MFLITKVKVRYQKNAVSPGFALPSVLILSIILLAIGVSTLQVSAAISRSLVDQHWNRLAKIAAQSGASFVSSCINQGYVTWTTTLTPQNKCSGAVVAPANPLYTGSGSTAAESPSKWQSTYTISPPVKGSDGIRRAKILGKVEVLSTTNIIVKTYTWDYHTIINGPKASAKAIAGAFAVYDLCALTADTSLLYCSGANSNGQLGIGTDTASQKTPVNFRLPAGETIADTGDGLYQNRYTCVRTNSLQVYCAGQNYAGQLGIGNTADQYTPIRFQIPASKDVAKLIMGNGSNTCVLTTDQLVFCSGDNSTGALGIGSTANTYLPVQFPLPVGQVAADVSIGSSIICVITTDQLMYCSGSNSFGELGLGDTTSRLSPVQYPLPGGKKVKAMSNTFIVLCALTTDQLVYCSGNNWDGQMGQGVIGGNQLTPIQFPLPGGRKAQEVQTEGYNTCVLTTDQLIFCAGSNSYGGLGVGDTADKPTPVQFPLPEAVVSLRNVNGTNVCAITISQALYCSGYNAEGQLGVGDTVDRFSPVQYPLPAGKLVKSVSGHQSNICALSTDQLMYCTGSGWAGQFGLGNTSGQTTPTLYGLF